MSTSTEDRTLRAIGVKTTIASGSAVTTAAWRYSASYVIKDYRSIKLWAYNSHAGGTANAIDLTYDASMDGSNWYTIGTVGSLQGTLTNGTFLPSFTDPYYYLRIGAQATSGTAFPGTLTAYMMGRR